MGQGSWVDTRRHPNKFFPNLADAALMAFNSACAVGSPSVLSVSWVCTMIRPPYSITAPKPLLPSRSETVASSIAISISVSRSVLFKFMIILFRNHPKIAQILAIQRIRYAWDGCVFWSDAGQSGDPALRGCWILDAGYTGMNRSKIRKHPACRAEALKERRLETSIQDQSTMPMDFVKTARVQCNILCNYKVNGLRHRCPYIAENRTRFSGWWSIL